jgi:hypothetical protein
MADRANVAIILNAVQLATDEPQQTRFIGKTTRARRGVRVSALRQRPWL